MPLFSPNNHSVWQIKYRPVDQERTAFLKSILAAQYSTQIEVVTSIEQVDETEFNSNNFKITGTKNGKHVVFLLRRVPKTRFIDDVQHAIDIMRKLDTRGVAVPKARESDTGLVVIEAPEEWFVLFEFIDGNHYRGTWEEVSTAGSVIAEMDSQLLLLTPEYKDDPRLQFSEAYRAVREFSVPIWNDIFTKAEAFGAKEGKESFAFQLLQHREEIIAAIESLSNAPNSTFQLMHFDLHPHNMLADGKKLLAILDFDSVKYVEKMRAVAFALHRLVRQYMVYTNPADVKGEVTRAKNAFIESYRSKNELTDADVQTIPYFIAHESLSRLTTAMKEYASTGSLAWQGDLSKQLTNMHEAQFFIED